MREKQSSVLGRLLHAYKIDSSGLICFQISMILTLQKKASVRSLIMGKKGVKSRALFGASEYPEIIEFPDWLVGDSGRLTGHVCGTLDAVGTRLK